MSNTNDLRRSRPVRVSAVLALAACAMTTTDAIAQVRWDQEHERGWVRRYGNDQARGTVHLDLTAGAGRFRVQDRHDEWTMEGHGARGLRAAGELRADVRVVGRRVSVARFSAHAASHGGYRWQRTKTGVRREYERRVRAARNFLERMILRMGRSQILRSLARPAQMDSADEVRMSFRLGNEVLVDRHHSSRVTYQRNFGPYNAMRRGIDKRFQVGPVPVRVRGNVGAGGRLATTFTLDRHERSAHIEGGPQAYANAWMSASVGGSVGIGGAEAGVRGETRFAHSKLTLDADIRDGRLRSSSLRCRFEAVRLRLELFARGYVNLIFGRVGRSWSKTIYEWSNGGFTIRR